MDLKNDFDLFLGNIRPTDNQRSDLQTGHKTLRDRLHADKVLSTIIVSDFLQGSYRRATAIRPLGERRSDVDIVVVTKLSESEYSPAAAMDVFKPFLKKHYEGKWLQQGRSLGIELSYVELDLVVTSAPSESELAILKSESVTSDDDLVSARDWRLNKSWLALNSRQRADARDLLAEARQQPEWKLQPLRIPNRDAGKWEPTHPLEQIRWTRDKNAKCNGHFVNVVKSIKWWRISQHEDPKHPKGFPLERLIGDCCPDDVQSVAEGIARTLETITLRYAPLAQTGAKPVLPDYGVPSHDVFARISMDDFVKFHAQVTDGAKLARRALDSNDRIESGNLWRELFGHKFPKPPEGSSTTKGGFTPPQGPAVPNNGRFA
jgi:hypothetical protein